MNIFEQYGIKEIADCTLYAIECDKYGDEVYIPIMYFDTLKVSTVEQATSQTLTRGGRGNPAQIGWDYGKEITVTLEDALYTPASQSLMWGSKFNLRNFKLRGVWNPYLYSNSTSFERTFYYPVNCEKDQYDKYQPVIEYNEEQETDCVYCYIPSESDYFYVPVDTLQQCCKTLNYDGKPYYYKNEGVIEGTYKYLYESTDPYPRTELINFDQDNISYRRNFLYSYKSDALYDKSKWDNNERPEIAEITLQTYGNFSMTYQDGGRDIIHNIQYLEDGNSGDCKFMKYIWEDVEIKMASLEGARDIYYMDHCNLAFQVRNNFQNRFITMATSYYRPTVYNPYEQSWNPSKVDIFIDDPRNHIFKEQQSWAREMNSYYPEIDFYTVIEEKDPLNNKVYNVYKKIGTFFIIEDWNMKDDAQDLIYPINKGFSQVKYIERVQKCTAPRQFAIDVDKNLLSSNYRYLQKYKYNELTVYIDPKTMKPYLPNSSTFKNAKGETLVGHFKVFKENEIYYKWERVKAPPNLTIGNQLIIDAEHYPGTYRLVGETYSKNRIGENIHYQFEIPLAKMSTENKLSLAASGDPSTFTFKLKALRREDGVMMKITEYTTDCNYYDNYCSDSDKVVPLEALEDNDIKHRYNYSAQAEMGILYPSEEELYRISINDPNEQITPIVNLDKIEKTKIETYSDKTLQLLAEEYLNKNSIETLTPGEDYTITIKNNRTEATE